MENQISTMITYSPPKSGEETSTYITTRNLTNILTIITFIVLFYLVYLKGLLLSLLSISHQYNSKRDDKDYYLFRWSVVFVLFFLIFIYWGYDDSYSILNLIKIDKLEAVLILSFFSLPFIFFFWDEIEVLWEKIIISTKSYLKKKYEEIIENEEKYRKL